MAASARENPIGTEPNEEHPNHVLPLHNSHDVDGGLESNAYDENRHNAHDEPHLLPSPDQVPTELPEQPPGDSGEAARRLNDYLELQRAERIVSSQENRPPQKPRSRGVHRASFRREADSSDDFKSSTTEMFPRGPSEQGFSTWTCVKSQCVGKLPRFARYFAYMLPLCVTISIPLLFSLFPAGGTVGIFGEDGVPLLWFCIWLEVVWCSWWLSRMLTSLMPSVFRLCAAILGSTDPGKWKEVGVQLDFHAALFIWLSTIFLASRPLLEHHGVPETDVIDEDINLPVQVEWVILTTKIISALFVLSSLNFAEKICIQCIATAFRRGRYSQRIYRHRTSVNYLIYLFDFARKRDEEEGSAWGSPRMSDARASPMQRPKKCRGFLFQSRSIGTNFGGTNPNDRKGTDKDHTRRIVYELLGTTPSAHSLARFIFHSLRRDGKDTLTLDDLAPAFTNMEDAEVALAIFDKDLNGDITVTELELVCNEIHLENKAIAASLKDLKSVTQKIDKIFMFAIITLVTISFISVFSGSAAAGLLSLSGFFLGVSWMFQVTAAEFLQSMVFVFVKHPFNVGDRVTVYRNDGCGNDYYVTKISLLYTEFKNMDGQVRHVANLKLNTLDIINNRRSGALADTIQLKIGFGCPFGLIEELEVRMLDFCLANKRDYQERIFSEVKTIDNVQGFTLNIIFFHKSNCQNERLRLKRHTNFTSRVMAEMQALDIPGPWRVQPGATRELPIYYTSSSPPPTYESTRRTGGGPTNEDVITISRALPTQPPISAPLQTPSAVDRERAENRARAQMDESFEDFQDVYELRRTTANQEVKRLQRIRGRASRERDRSVGARSVIRPSMDSERRRSSRFIGRSASGPSRPSDFV